MAWYCVDIVSTLVTKSWWVMLTLTPQLGWDIKIHYCKDSTYFLKWKIWNTRMICVYMHTVRMCVHVHTCECVSVCIHMCVHVHIMYYTYCVWALHHFAVPNLILSLILMILSIIGTLGQPLFQITLATDYNNTYCKHYHCVCVWSTMNVM